MWQVGRIGLGALSRLRSIPMELRLVLFPVCCRCSQPDILSRDNEYRMALANSCVSCVQSLWNRNILFWHPNGVFSSQHFFQDVSKKVSVSDMESKRESSSKVPICRLKESEIEFTISFVLSDSSAVSENLSKLKKVTMLRQMRPRLSLSLHLISTCVLGRTAQQTSLSYPPVGSGVWPPFMSPFYGGFSLDERSLLKVLIHAIKGATYVHVQLRVSSVLYNAGLQPQQGQLHPTLEESKLSPSLPHRPASCPLNPRASQ